MSAELEALLDELVAAGVLVEHDDDSERLDLTGRFASERETQRARLAGSDEEVGRFASVLDVEPAELDRETVADALAIQELAPAVDDRQAVLAADVVDRFTDEVLSAGVPEGFVSIRPGEVTTFVEQHDGAVVYFWADDCDPCDRMHEEFSGLVARDMVPDELELGAVYLGREADVDEGTAELLTDEWQVTIVPTTLFFLEGRIDSRYYDWKPQSALKQELDILGGYVTGEDRSLDPDEAVGAERPGDEPAEPARGAGDEPVEPARDAGDVPDDVPVTANVTEDASARDVEEVTAPPSAADDAGGEYEDVRRIAESFTDVREYIEAMTADGENIAFERGDAEELEEVFEGVEHPDALWRPEGDGPVDGRPAPSERADGEEPTERDDPSDGS